MAIQKEIELENGIILNYHRITSLNKITNISNNIEVNSYINQSQREKEKQYQQIQLKKVNKEILTEEEEEIVEKGINVLVQAECINIPYDGDMTIEKAYSYLKNTDKFKESVDI